MLLNACCCCRCCWIFLSIFLFCFIHFRHLNMQRNNTLSTTIKMLLNIACNKIWMMTLCSACVFIWNNKNKKKTFILCDTKFNLLDLLTKQKITLTIFNSYKQNVVGGSNFTIVNTYYRYWLGVEVIFTRAVIILLCVEIYSWWSQFENTFYKFTIAHHAL